jgi:UDP-glucuronate decarboxylase
MKRVLVTGGAGFIGSHLCEQLLDHGDEVICVDNFYTGNVDNIAELKGSERFRLIEHDIIDPLDLEVDQIYNLACPASPVHYQKDKVRTIRTSVDGVRNMLELAQRCGARMLQASTSEVYGDPLVHPQTEDYWGYVNPNGPRSCYDEGKRVAESLMFAYSEQRGVDIRVARIFNTYGPKMQADDGRVVSNFIVQALRGEDITMYGHGNQTRSFCYVSDLVDGLQRLMGSDTIGPINLGNPRESTVKELAEMVQSMVGGPSQLVYRPLPRDDPTRRKPDITLARKHLDWEPKVPLEQGLRRTIDHFRTVTPLGP